MTANGISPKAQEEIILSITSFALYGFPESHAASFALLAYASAYLKCHYLAAFTAALLNNQPMGFYHPATIVSDAQRHGLKVLPVDVTKSDWRCTLEHSPFCTPHPADLNFPLKVKNSHVNDIVIPSADSHPESRKLVFSNKERDGEAEIVLSSGARDPGSPSHYPSSTIHSLRLGLRYVRGLHEEAGEALVRERVKKPFTSIHDLIRRVPELRKDELDTLSEIGALNSIGGADRSAGVRPAVAQAFAPAQPAPHPSAIPTKFHRRDALWQVERAVRYSGPLLEELPELDSQSPLHPMNHEERLVADYHGTGMTIGPHPMAYQRKQMNRLGVRRASELAHLRNGRSVSVAGCVIVRQRPGTAKGFVFLSMEDETGIANVIITPDMFQKNRLLLVREKFVLVEGILQNQDNVISIKARRILPLNVTQAETTSHDFH
jgi:error-prone DNA polymerase